AGGRDRTEGLLDRHDVVVDGLGQAHHGQVVAVLLQVGGQVGCGGVGVVTADGVQHVHAVGPQLLGRDLQRVLAFANQAALGQILGIGQFHPAVADRAAAEVVQDVDVGLGFGIHHGEVPGEQAVVAVLVGDDLGL